MKKKFLSSLTLFFLLFSLALTFSASAAEEENFDEEIVVTATKIPLKVSESPGMTQTIDQDEIEENLTLSLAEILSNQGLTVSTYGGDCSVATIRLGGATAEQTMIMIDGIPVLEGTTGMVDLGYLSLAGVEKIEVAHGPLSALYGANALGGVVNIIPELTGKPDLLLNLSGGSYTSGRTGLQIKRERWGLALGGNTTEGYRPHSSANGAYLSAQYNLVDEDDAYLKVYSGYRTRKAQIPGDNTPDPYLGNQEDQNFFFNLSGQKDLAGGYGEGKISYQTWDNYYEDLKFNAKDLHQSKRWGTDLAYFYEAGDHRLLSGLSSNYDTFQSTATGDHQRRETGIYLQDLWDLSDNLSLQAGLRWDKINDLSALSPRIGVTGFLSDRFSLGISYGSAFRAPTINDLYWEPYANPGLKPEKGQRLELTGHWRTAHSLLSANVFQSYIKDGITFSSVSFRPENIEKLKTTGFSLNSNHQLGLLTANIGYTFLNKQGWESQTANYSQNLNYFGQHQLALKVRASLGKINVRTGCQMVSGRSQQFDYTTFQEAPMPDYTLFSAGLQYQLNNLFSSSLDWDNIANTAYEIHRGYPMPGSNLRFTISYRY